MKRQRKNYSRPLKPYDKARIEAENKILADYGLRRKNEVWKAEEILRDFRRRARNLEAFANEEQKKLLIIKLFRLGLVGKDAKMDDVLTLTIDKILGRRMQSIVLKKGLAKTQKQARQFIVHGHISVNGRRNMWPSMLVTTDEEQAVGFYANSPVGAKK